MSSSDQPPVGDESGSGQDLPSSSSRPVSKENEELVQQLQAITGLPEQAAKELLSGAGGNLKTAVDLFFDQSIEHAPTVPLLTRNAEPRVSAILTTPIPAMSAPSLATRCRSIAELLVEQTSKFISLAMSSLWLLLSGLVRPISGAHYSSSFDTSFRRLLLTAEDGTARPGPISFPNASVVQIMPTACSELKPVFAFVMNTAVLSSSQCSNLRHLLSMVMTAEVQQSLNEDTCLLGFDPKASLTNRITCRTLQLDQNTPLSVCILLPLVLSPQLAAQFRRLLNPNGTAAEMMSYHALGTDVPAVRGNSLSQADAEAAFTAIQSKFVSLVERDQIPSLGDFKLSILRNGCIQCYSLALTSQHAVDPLIVRSSIVQAVAAAAALVEPMKEMRSAEQARREADRRLIAEQQREYEESLAADRARAQEKREAEAKRQEEEAARQQAKEAEEARERDRLSSLKSKASMMLEAEPTAVSPENEVFADILLRMGSTNERFRLRVSKDVKYKALLDVVSCLEYIIRTSNSILWVRPAADPTTVPVACRVENSGGGVERVVSDPPSKGYHVSTALAGGVKLDPECTIEECRLLPNAMLHVRAA